MSTQHLTSIYVKNAAQRVMSRCDILAQIRETPEQLIRVYLSREHFCVNRQVKEWMGKIGMCVWEDSVGNICGRYEGLYPEQPALLLASHLDTVRNAGRYDGVLGVLIALEVVEYLHNINLRLPMAIEIIGFADEEGTRFGIALLGSKAITGSWSMEWLTYQDDDGISLKQAMIQSGLNPASIGQAKRDKADFSAYLELHIEQGPRLEQAGVALGVVTAINGARRLKCSFTGKAGHGGTVPMACRKDALNTAACWIAGINNIIAACGTDMVATVGKIGCLPGVVNVIPGEVWLTLDVRGPDDSMLHVLLDKLLSSATVIAARQGVIFHSEEIYSSDAIPCDTRLLSLLSESLRRIQGCSPMLSSGAGHDAVAIAKYWPFGMLFVRCAGGISHHPDESVTTDDVVLAIRAYVDVVISLSSQIRNGILLNHDR